MTGEGSISRQGEYTRTYFFCFVQVDIDFLCLHAIFPKLDEK